MSSIKAFESLSGRVSSGCTLSGTLSCEGGLSGKVSIPSNYERYERYDGNYEAVPNAFNTQTLPTANKLLTQDVIVKKVPYYETSNIQQGITVYIAGEEN